MSKRKVQIDVCPEHLSPGGQMKELFVSKGHKCCYCQGNGYFWGRDDVSEAVKEPCQMCGGSGELDAIVTVEWRKGEKVKG